VRPEGGSAGALLPAVRSALARVDRERAVTRVRTLADVASEATSRPRFRALIVGAFALLALVLAMVGVFGVLAHSVEQRTRELGIRIALGATAGGVLRLVLGGAGIMIAAGAATGLVVAAGLAQFISSVLFGVQPLDPVTFGGVALVLALTAAAAAAVPALRATRVDPAVTFRAE
jgi:putative ABC transport system permease protein